MLVLALFNAERLFQEDRVLRKQSLRLSEWIAWQEEQALSLLAKINADGFDRMGDQGDVFTLLLHRGDSILYVSNSRALPTLSALRSRADVTRRYLLRQPAGFFAVYDAPAIRLNAQVKVLIPIRYGHSTGAPKRREVFPYDASLPEEIAVSETPGAFPIIYGGASIAGLEARGPVQPAWISAMKVALNLLLLFILFALMTSIAHKASKRLGVWAGGGIIAALGAALFAAFVWTGYGHAQFGALPVFNEPLQPGGQTPMGIGRLGHWIFAALVLLWAAFSLPPNPSRRALPKHIALSAAGAYAIILGAVLLFALMIRAVMSGQRTQIDADHFLNLNDYNLYALSGLLLLIPGLFAVSQKLFFDVASVKLPFARRLPALALGYAIFAAAALAFWGWDVWLPMILGFALLFLLGLDAAAHAEMPPLLWIGSWLLLTAFISAATIGHFSRANKAAMHRDYALGLAEARDSAVAERLLPQWAERVRNDSVSLGALLKPWPFVPERETVRDWLVESAYQYNYLFQHYRIDALAFDRDGQPLLRGQQGDQDYIRSLRLDEALRIRASDPNLRFARTADGRALYVARFEALRMGDPKHPTEVYVLFEQRFPTPSRVYSQLFYPFPYKLLPGLNECDFAVQIDGGLIAEQGRALPALAMAQPAPGQYERVEAKALRRAYTVAAGADGRTTVAAGGFSGGAIKVAYLFSFIFSVGALLLLILLLAAKKSAFLSRLFTLRLDFSGALVQRIHNFSILLVGLAAVLIGVLTYRQFTAAARDAAQTNLNARAEALHAHLKSRLWANPSAPSDSIVASLAPALDEWCAALGLDANLYRSDQNLLHASNPDLASLCLIPRRLRRDLSEQISEKKIARITDTEEAAGYEYNCMYMPLFDRENKPAAILSVPYRIGLSGVGPEVSDFIGKLASLYIVLLFLAYTATYYLAQNIIRPLAAVSEKISQLKLENKNEPVEYVGAKGDEVGILVAEYNRMVEKIEESKAKLIRLERESAWREMARQVAHDIKNPLTTMKLSMQQLERVSSNPEQASAYLKKAITRLIEQIDSLAQIASEFSMFANLDIREKHDMVLNDVVESVYDLFNEQDKARLQLQLPEQRFHIYGDKNHLIRVFNNLVINAIQAIPSDREGLIRVSLRQKGSKAIVKISDNGGGIPPEIRDRVFEPNFTTKSSGSGLGLAICRKIIEALDGSIHFETRENEGTDFFVELPITSFSAN
ncbi:MAG: ATP-binding protein [Saprospiraceae bacterium]